MHSKAMCVSTLVMKTIIPNYRSIAILQWHLDCTLGFQVSIDGYATNAIIYLSRHHFHVNNNNLIEIGVICQCGEIVNRVGMT